MRLPPEIMAPVGCWESLSSALQAQADSIYFGIDKLNMRSRSSLNFSLDDLPRIVSRCRERGVRTYLTLNTVMYPEDLPLAYRIIDAAHESGVDAVIASDVAVMARCNSVEMPVHLSTQLNISNVEALRFYAQFADVAVLARELNLSQVQDISRTIEREHICGRNGALMRLEMFCHGALCMAVSGKCYLSLHNFNQSANRGACVQVCRRGYTVRDNDSEMELAIDNEYIMSPKDLKTIHFLNKILDAGVSVLKIEGRARGPEYVATVVSCYKEAVNAYERGEWDDTHIAERIKEWDTRLTTVFNRGFWDGYYLGQRLGEWTHTYGNQASKTKTFAGKCTNFYKNIGVAEFILEAVPCLEEGDELLITGDTTGVISLIASKMRDEKGNESKKITQGEVFAIKMEKLCRRGDKLFIIKEAQRGSV